MGPEKRSSAREEYPVMVEQLFKAIHSLQESNKELDSRLRQHMQMEEQLALEQKQELQSFFDGVSSKLNPIIDSLPRNEQGVPDPYIHRVQHEALRNSYKLRGKVVSGFFAEAGRALLLTLLVLIASGNLSTLFKAVLH